MRKIFIFSIILALSGCGYFDENKYFFTCEGNSKNTGTLLIDLDEDRILWSVPAGDSNFQICEQSDILLLAKQGLGDPPFLACRDFDFNAMRNAELKVPGWREQLEFNKVTNKLKLTLYQWRESYSEDLKEIKGEYFPEITLNFSCKPAKTNF